MNNVIDANADSKNYRLTVIVYALQAVGIIMGITFFIAVIINYVKRSDVENTWLASHFTWQIRTFWYGILWLILGGITFYLIIGMIIAAAATIWIIYRVVKGWIYLSDHKPMYSR